MWNKQQFSKIKKWHDFTCETNKNKQKKSSNTTFYNNTYVIHYSNNQFISFFINIDITVQFPFNFATIRPNKLVFDSIKRYDSLPSFYAKFIKFGSIVIELHSILVIDIKNLSKLFPNIFFL